MRRVTFSPPVQWEVQTPTGSTRRITTFQDWLVEALNQSERFAKGLDNIVEGIRLREAVNAPGDSGLYEDADYATLTQVLDAAAWNPMFARYLGPFVKAWRAAEQFVVNAEIKEEKRRQKP